MVVNNTALLIIDVQQGMFTEDNPVYKGKQLLTNIEQLIIYFRSQHLPIYYIQHTEPAGREFEKGSPAWMIHPQIAPTASDIVIEKTTPDSFHHTELHQELKKSNIEHLLLTGIQSDVCVDTTCRRAFSLGYKSTLVIDAHSTWGSSELTAQQIINHHNQVLRWFAKTNETKDIVLR
ncbi:cysteine hydrolase family protein [Paenibacillus arenosi]|uniref:Cysteine hydrolase n=1 Tax=Paenibacillus arenosi TaxID=2774142 RepID=A0ABR9AWR7_9BACL|nr:cysteine hydrolase family protein [Paenibacillus arenosi]MBD8498572.1 cysteine hydrolase [Paenibacillus arenosi]